MDIRWTTLFLDLPAEHYQLAAGFWAGATRSSLSPARGQDGEFATLLPGDGDAYLRLQQVRTGAGGIHLDLHVAGDTLTGAVLIAENAGASVRTMAQDVVVLGSPGGFTFCLVPWDGESRVPRPAELPCGPSRVDQLCLDIPADNYDRECDFWAALTGWELLGDDEDVEFRSLRRPAGLPIRLLLQRRDSSDPGDRVTGHLDVGAGPHMDALARDHVGLGARHVRDLRSWVVMEDPAGGTYCLTRRPAFDSDRPSA